MTTQNSLMMLLGISYSCLCLLCAICLVCSVDNHFEKDLDVPQTVIPAHYTPCAIRSPVGSQ